MKTKKVIETDGIVTEIRSNTKYKIKVQNDHELVAYMSGKMEKNSIRILLGDRVKVEIPHDDPTKGRITFRYR